MSARRRTRLACIVVAAFGWLAVATVTVLGLTAATVAVGAVASTATVCAALYDILPPVVDAWDWGREYGYRRGREDGERNGLRVVRSRR